MFGHAGTFNLTRDFEDFLLQKLQTRNIPQFLLTWSDLFTTFSNGSPKYKIKHHVVRWMGNWSIRQGEIIGGENITTNNDISELAELSVMETMVE